MERVPARRVRVELLERSYDILIQAGILAQLGPLAAKFCRDGQVLVVTDRNVGKAYEPMVASSLEAAGLTTRTTTVPPGERSKSPTWLGRLYDSMVACRLSRESLVVALGGGVVGDLAGFAAATYMRGINLVQAPTSLLAMIDSSVGGKTAINHPAGKNLIGAFAQPRLVACDPDALRTLPLRELRTGLAEAIKHGIITDATYFAQIETSMPRLLKRDPEALAEVIRGSCEIKARVVSADERESGLRRVLNYGHTFGHAIEKAARYRRVRHGEAVALGMVAAGRLSVSLGLLSLSGAQRIETLIEKAGFPTQLSGIDETQAIAAMQIDKKASARELRMVISPQIGEAQVITNPDTQLVHNALRSVLCV